MQPAAFRRSSRAAVAGRPERADRWRALIEAPESEQRLALVGASVGRGLLAQPKLPDANRAQILTGIAMRLWDGGDRPGAIAALRETVELRRRLAQANPGRFDLPLAQALAALSNRLGEHGEASEAVAASPRRSRCAAGWSARTPSVTSRNWPIVSACCPAGWPRRTRARRRWRRLRRQPKSAAGWRRPIPAKCEHDLSASLNALSIRRSDIGDRAGAMAATQEGVALRRRLALRDPARHEPGLAQSLHNLAIRLVEVDDGPPRWRRRRRRCRSAAGWPRPRRRASNAT